MKRILLQLDTDAHASSFDAVTALDSGIDHLLSHGLVNTSNVVPLVQGTIFTRGPKELKNTAIFIGGSDVESGEKLLAKVQEAFFGPMRVSVMMDSNGCNTTAAAAVVSAQKHIDLSQTRAVVLGGTGPVGRRVAQILGSHGAQVVVTSRSLSKARHVCSLIDGTSSHYIPGIIPEEGDLCSLLEGANLLIAAGAAGVQFTNIEDLSQCESLKVVIDLNAVPPLGVEGIQSTDKARKIGSITCYGALGVGGLKMKIHHHLIEQLFEANDHIFDTSQIYNSAVKLGQM